VIIKQVFLPLVNNLDDAVVVADDEHDVLAENAQRILPRE